MKGVMMGPGNVPRFGGSWTDKKLRAISEYLSAYTTALKNTPFKKAYIDAFAGTGYRAPRSTPDGVQGQQLLFPDLAEPEPQALLEGSARLALRAEPRFDKYIFIESDPRRCAELQHLKEEVPYLAQDIQIHRGDANAVIRKLCGADWSRHRAVVFLDPYGMPVEWPTIEAIAATRAIDLWILFPLGIGVNRLLKRDGDIPHAWRRRLDLVLGSSDWYEAFFKVQVETDLFGEQRQRVIKATIATIGEYFLERLRTVFPAVAPRPAVLPNTKKSPLYLLCFAIGSHKRSAQETALRYILKEAG